MMEENAEDNIITSPAKSNANGNTNIIINDLSTKIVIPSTSWNKKVEATQTIIQQGIKPRLILPKSPPPEMTEPKKVNAKHGTVRLFSNQNQKIILNSMQNTNTWIRISQKNDKSQIQSDGITVVKKAPAVFTQTQTKVLDNVRHLTPISRESIKALNKDKPIILSMIPPTAKVILNHKLSATSSNNNPNKLTSDQLQCEEIEIIDDEADPEESSSIIEYLDESIEEATNVEGDPMADIPTLMPVKTNKSHQLSSGLIIRNVKGETVNLQLANGKFRDYSPLKIIRVPSSKNISENTTTEEAVVPVNKKITSSAASSFVTIPHNTSISLISSDGQERNLKMRKQPLNLLSKPVHVHTVRKSICNVNGGKVGKRRAAKVSALKPLDVKIKKISPPSSSDSSPDILQFGKAPLSLLKRLKPLRKNILVTPNSSESKNKKIRTHPELVNDEDANLDIEESVSQLTRVEAAVIENEVSSINENARHKHTLADQNKSRRIYVRRFSRQSENADNNSADVTEIIPEPEIIEIPDDDSRPPPPTVTTPSLFCDEKLDNISNEDNNKSSNATSSNDATQIFENNYCIDADLVRSNSIFQVDESDDDTGGVSGKGAHSKKSNTNIMKRVEKELQNIRNKKNKQRRKSMANASKVDSSFTITTAAIPTTRTTTSTAITNILLNLDNEEIDLDYDDALNSVKFIDGIGYLGESNLHIQYNAFGLVELVSDNEYKRYLYTKSNENDRKPLRFRRNDTEKQYRNSAIDNSNDLQTLYKCVQCKERGYAKEFYAPEYCSKMCCERNLDRIARLPIRSSITSEVSSITQFASGPTTSDEENTVLGDPSVAPRSRQRIKIIPNEYSFDWEKYLGKERLAQSAAALNLFINPFPSSPNRFKTGMKLEAIDPNNHSLFCVCTIVEVRGFRIKLKFDGYSIDYDFWVNADSIDIFPPDWCRRTNRKLVPPIKFPGDIFNWTDYLKQTNSVGAPREFFTHLNSSSTKNPFKIGMKMEAENVKLQKLLSVATVVDKLENRILLHFDSSPDSYDHWYDITSPQIHPIDYHKNSFIDLQPPSPYDKNTFTWRKYLKDTKAIAATEGLFCVREGFAFDISMKLEIVDIKNRSLIRPATILELGVYEIKVLYDGWPNDYEFWIDDDSPDIHPINWCKTTAHPIEPPPTLLSKTNSPCGVKECTGLGNAKSNATKHTTKEECPYDMCNWKTGDDLPLRVHADYVFSKNKNSMKRKSEHVTRQEESEREITAPRHSAKRQKSNQSDRDKININVAKHFLKDYGPQLSRAQRLRLVNSENLGEPKIMKNPITWSVKDVCEYIRKIPNCENLTDLFRNEEINGYAFINLNQDDLQACLSIKTGPAVKIYNRILYLRGLTLIEFS